MKPGQKPNNKGSGPDPDEKPMQRLLRGPLPWIIALAAALWLGVSFVQAATAPSELTWNEFQAAVENGQLSGQDLDVTTIGNRSDTIEGTRRVGGSTVPFTTTFNPDINAEQLRNWIEQGQIGSVEFNAEQTGAITSILATVLPFMLILVVFFLLMQNMQVVTSSVSGNGLGATENFSDPFWIIDGLVWSTVPVNFDDFPMNSATNVFFGFS